MSPAVEAQARVAPSLNPNLAVRDPVAAWWLNQVTLRLRREVCWCRHQRGEGVASEQGALPPPGDPAQESLDLTRYRDEKRAFFASDVTARYLSERIAESDPPRRKDAASGFGRAAEALALDPAAQFVLALALAARLDAALGPVFAACQADAARPYPTLALAQRLWDDPLTVAACGDPAHPLFRFGLVSLPSAPGLDWLQPLEMASTVSQALLAPAPPPRAPVSAFPPGFPPAARAAVAHLVANPPQRLQIVPLIGPRAGDFAAWARVCAHLTERGLAELPPHASAERGHLLPAAAAAWLRGEDILLPEEWAERATAHAEPWHTGLAALPLRWYLPVQDAAHLKSFSTLDLAAAVQVPALDFASRLELLKGGLGNRAPQLSDALREAARRFRFERRVLERVVRALNAFPGKLAADQLIAACRAEVVGQMGGLATPVNPRFRLDEVVLPKAHAAQLAEIAGAMKVLPQVHYEWGTAQAWNESGLSVLFCGPPGTGKTMAAEGLARELDMPLYRIDLSQVVNKYIGETEKNLKQVFDAAESSDCILFFDEADALFGKRTEVKDAHDRFANIEVSYLLERMERLKGLAILATNRRKDLDEAFTRRLRYVVEFPVPGATERERIWRQVFPPEVDVDDVDFAYLGRQFEIAGGHIRSAAFNACLQAAAAPAPAHAQRAASPRVTMAAVANALRRELQKMDRVVGPEQFGSYARLLAEHR
jgi:vesicle-fusing ATPase